MTPADRLIVALDVPVDVAFDLVRRLRPEVRLFKLGIGSFLDANRDGISLALFIGGLGGKIMLDLKLYDTRDTVLRTLAAVERIGAAMVTVHATCVPSALDADCSATILAVGALTDSDAVIGPDLTRERFAHHRVGAVCPAIGARYLRSGGCHLIVCPGIRPAGIEPDNHTHPCTPGAAIRNGADYIVVGRPIYTASDPAEAAQAITREIEEALAQAGEGR